MGTRQEAVRTPRPLSSGFRRPPPREDPTMSQFDAPLSPSGRTVTSPFAGEAGWTEIDVRAVDTARLLAADAVQKAGNGHPGTAMSLAPLAHLLFQNVMRHDP